VKGRCDFYLNGELRWALEALINGNGVKDLAPNDYLVIDFRVNDTGEPTNVERHEHRMTVFFKQGDFRYCSVVCGLEQPAERITLAN